MTLPHGWSLESLDAPGALVREFVEPAVAAIPESIATRFGACRLELTGRLGEPSASSRWTRAGEGITIEVAVAHVEHHDVAIELLVCAGQVLWELAMRAEREGYLRLLAAETAAGIEGEVNEEPLRQKQRLLLSKGSARNIYRLERYARSSFAHTAAEYVHSLWHDVTVRRGPEHLPPHWLRRRLQAMERWYPPNPGYALFPSVQG